MNRLRIDSLVRVAMVLAALTAAGCLTATVVRAEVAAILVDDFTTVDAWSGNPADGVDLSIAGEAGVMRLDFSFGKGSGYAVARRAVALDLPENYVFAFRIRGECPENHLEFKLVDASGENVWWSVRRDMQFPADWETLRIKKRHITFAWGPQGGGEIRHVAAIEFAVTAGAGGTGSVWIDDLRMVPRPPASAIPPTPIATARASAESSAPGMAVDGDSTSVWVSAVGEERPSLTLDLGAECEYGGVVIDWAPRREAAMYSLESSTDELDWRPLREVVRGNGGRDYHLLPESESRFLRIRAQGPLPHGSMGVREVKIEPLGWGASMETFFAAIAKDAPRGFYPRAIGGERIAWTVVGDGSGGRQEGLLSEDGALETGKSAFSIEPFLYTDGRLITWDDVRATPSLTEGGVPIPRVRWEHERLELEITAFAVDSVAAAGLLGRSDARELRGSFLVGCYRVRNRLRAEQKASLYLAVRPFQVNPPTQFLNAPGGTAVIRSIALDGQGVLVNHDKGLSSLTPFTAFGAAAFEEGDVIADYLSGGRLPERTEVVDVFGKASGALAYELDLAPGAEEEVDIIVPLVAKPGASIEGPPTLTVDSAERRCQDAWLALRGRIAIEAPSAARDLLDTMWAQLGYILINRDRAAIQPGSRSYERSWIRDGALTSSALLRLGHPEVVRSFIEWFAPNQYANGKIPCVVDARGPDPVPEHDSSGEFIFLVAEYDRYVRNRDFLETMWPRVERAAAYLDSLRRTRRTAEYEKGDARRFYGLLPPSISHEGYSAKPMHSYWDDLFALRGFKDATAIAERLGRWEDARRLGAIRDEFAHDLSASIAATIEIHGIDYMPGCADLGDFDATSTTIALDPVDARGAVPDAPLQRTFDRYWEFFVRRRDGVESWEAFTPYEVRNIGAFVQLGRRDQAQELTRYFLEHRDPPGWQQWAEVVWREPRIPRFIGDMPHTWVGSDYIRSVLDMLAYDRDEDGALVIGAGVPIEWLRDSPGLRVSGLPTAHGVLAYSMSAAGDSMVVRIEDGLTPPCGGIAIRPPVSGRSMRATVRVGGATRHIRVGEDGEVVVRGLPVTVVVRP